MKLADCGTATKVTMGRLIGALTEGGAPPFNKWCGRANCFHEGDSAPVEPPTPPDEPEKADGSK